MSYCCFRFYIIARFFPCHGTDTEILRLQSGLVLFSAFRQFNRKESSGCNSSPWLITQTSPVRPQTNPLWDAAYLSVEDGVQVGNVSLVMEIDASAVGNPLSTGITAQIDMVEALVLFQRIYIFGVAAER